MFNELITSVTHWVNSITGGKEMMATLPKKQTQLKECA